MPDAYFIHVPKTGGSTVYSVIKKYPKNIEPLHMRVDFSSEVGGSDGMLEKLINMEIPIFIMLRDPVEQYMSSYYFYTRYPGIRHRLPCGDSIESYADFEPTRNQQIQFLTKKFVLDADKPGVCKEDLEKVKRLVDKPNVHVGFTDDIDGFLMTMDRVMNTDQLYSYYKTHGLHMKCNFVYQAAYMLPDMVQAKIAENVRYDTELYNYCKEKSVSSPPLPPKKAIRLDFPETFPVCMFELCLGQLFFYKYGDVNDAIWTELKTKNITDREEYCIQWLQLFIQRTGIECGVDTLKPQKSILRMLQGIEPPPGKVFVSAHTNLKNSVSHPFPSPKSLITTQSQISKCFSTSTSTPT
jgi:hypothetical protein